MIKNEKKRSTCKNQGGPFYALNISVFFKLKNMSILFLLCLLMFYPMCV